MGYQTTESTEKLLSNVQRLLSIGKKKFALVPENALAQRIHRFISEFITEEKVQCRIWNYDPPDGGLPAEYISSQDSDAILNWQPDALVICEDGMKIRYMSSLNKAPWISFPEVLIYGSDHHFIRQREAEEMESTTGEKSHAVGYSFAKANILELLTHYAAIGKRGTILELGVFRGGTLLLIEKMLKSLDFNGNRLLGFDTWSGFPRPRSLLDMYADSAYVHTDFEDVSQRLCPLGIELVRGDIIDTMRSIPFDSLLLTFIDTDNYSPVKHALPLIAARTIRGGSIVFDHYYALEEYNDAFGEGVAAAEFFQNHNEFVHLSGTGVFMKMA